MEAILSDVCNCDDDDDVCMMWLVLNENDDCSLTLLLVFKDGMDDKDDSEGMKASPSCIEKINDDSRKKDVDVFIAFICDNLILQVVRVVIIFLFDSFLIH